MTNETSLREYVIGKFRSAGIEPVAVEIRTFPGETIAIVDIDKDFELALKVASSVDLSADNGFVTVRRTPSKTLAFSSRKAASVHDDRIPELIGFLNARSRTSESQPSLRYVQDVEERIDLATSSRHHLVFGRRGVGKTSLLLESKRLLESRGAFTLWVNVHSLRHLQHGAAFGIIGSRLCDLAIGAFQGGVASLRGSRLLEACRADLDEYVVTNASDARVISTLVPRLQQALSRFCIETNRPIFIFLDDVHYLQPKEVPWLLDMLLGITRDNPVWLKIAGIQHQTRWFIPDPPTGLQTGHDAALISLDVTLEQPERAKDFLLDVLRGYVEESGVLPISGFLSTPAIDRLVLASGGVPRDFLTLCAASLQTARQRQKARTVGVQDVNNAAGLAAKTKLQELEDDAAAARGRSHQLVASLALVRNFLLNEQQITYFKIDLRDKESHQDEYLLIQALADLRMLHLINASLSDSHEAGNRAEVYLLDLSQYSGSRLKHNLRVLDFEHGHMILKRTRTKEPSRVGDSARKLVDILRKGPVFDLESLRALLVIPGDPEAHIQSSQIEMNLGVGEGFR